jgi:rare lipoprotein A
MRETLLRRSLIGVYGLVSLLSTDMQADPWHSEKGLASHYGKEFQGKKTARGERFSQTEMMAAHRHLPLGTKVMVENIETGDKIEVKITDRGPYADRKRRIIDLSRAAAESIGLVEQGVGPVQVIVTEAPAETQKTTVDEETFFEVQVGAFEDSDEAQTVFNQIKPWFPKAYMVPHDGPAGEYYRVRIGPFKSKQDAQQIAQAMKQDGHRIFLDEVPGSTISDDAVRRVHGQESPTTDHRK